MIGFSTAHLYRLASPVGHRFSGTTSPRLAFGTKPCLLRFGNNTSLASNQPPTQNRWFWNSLLLMFVGLIGYGIGASDGGCSSSKQGFVKPVLTSSSLPDQEGLLIATPQELLQKVQADQVKTIEMRAYSTTLMWTVTLHNNQQQYFAANPQQEGYRQLIQALRDKGIHPKIASDSSGLETFFFIGGVFGVIALLAVLLNKLQNKMSQTSQILSNTSSVSGKTISTHEIPKITLQDVAGIPEVVQDIQADIVDLFQDRSSKVGEKLPKGILLAGPPGTGKTLIAKAIAGELKRPFFSMGGADFVEMYVGVGPSRVRDLFKAARERAPSVIFIDEIDALGKKRMSGTQSSGSSEYDNTLNALLAEMDGVDSKADVLVIAATNRPDVLDSALTRPGRFDRKYQVTPPMTPEGRQAILAVHLRDKKVDTDVNTLALARQLWSGTTGAQIETMVNEAALLARRKSHTAIQQADFMEAITRIHTGLAKTDVRLTAEDKRRTAVHEALGHAAVGLAVGLPPRMITIVPRNMVDGGTALGLVSLDPDAMPQHHQTRRDVENLVCMMLGGRAAEEAVFGKEAISMGASDDWKKANALLRQAIEEAVLYPELFGQVPISQEERSLLESGAPSGALKEKGEHVRGQLLEKLYQATLAFVTAIPEVTRNQILTQIEQDETLNDPTKIKALFESAGVSDWSALWNQEAIPLFSKAVSTEKSA